MKKKKKEKNNHIYRRRAKRQKKKEKQKMRMLFFQSTVTHVHILNMTIAHENFIHEKCQEQFSGSRKEIKKVQWSSRETKKKKSKNIKKTILKNLIHNVMLQQLYIYNYNSYSYKQHIIR
jgi:preprotein translocase subunit SecE